jgi:hypothetical protein
MSRLACRPMPGPKRRAGVQSSLKKLLNPASLNVNFCPHVANWCGVGAHGMPRRGATCELVKAVAAKLVTVSITHGPHHVHARTVPQILESAHLMRQPGVHQPVRPGRYAAGVAAWRVRALPRGVVLQCCLPPGSTQRVQRPGQPGGGWRAMVDMLSVWVERGGSL